MLAACSLNGEHAGPLAIGGVERIGVAHGAPLLPDARRRDRLQGRLGLAAAAALVCAALAPGDAEARRVDAGDGPAVRARQGHGVALLGVRTHRADRHRPEVDLGRVAAGLLEEHDGVGRAVGGVEEGAGHVVEPLADLAAAGEALLLVVPRHVLPPVVAAVAAVHVAGHVARPVAAQVVAVHVHHAFVQADQVHHHGLRASGSLERSLHVDR